MTSSLPPNFCETYGKEALSNFWGKLKDAMERMNMSSRAYDRILKAARTIADLEASADVIDHHTYLGNNI